MGHTICRVCGDESPYYPGPSRGYGLCDKEECQRVDDEDFRKEMKARREEQAKMKNPSNGYIFSFAAEGGRSRRIKWMRYGKDMESTFELAKQAALKDYPKASGFSITSMEGRGTDEEWRAGRERDEGGLWWNKVTKSWGPATNPKKRKKVKRKAKKARKVKASKRGGRFGLGTLLGVVAVGAMAIGAANRRPTA